MAYNEDQPRDDHGRWGEGGSDQSAKDAGTASAKARQASVFASGGGASADHEAADAHNYAASQANAAGDFGSQLYHQGESARHVEAAGYHRDVAKSFDKYKESPAQATDANPHPAGSVVGKGKYSLYETYSHTKGGSTGQPTTRAIDELTRRK